MGALFRKRRFRRQKRMTGGSAAPVLARVSRQLPIGLLVVVGMIMRCCMMMNGSSGHMFRRGMRDVRLLQICGHRQKRQKTGDKASPSEGL